MRGQRNKFCKKIMSTSLFYENRYRVYTGSYNKADDVYDPQEKWYFSSLEEAFECYNSINLYLHIEKFIVDEETGEEIASSLSSIYE